MSKKPEMLLVCGANGAGKSTFTDEVRQQNVDHLFLIDPDKIAKEAQVSPIKAGRLASVFTRKNIARKFSFIRESTLTARFDFQMIGFARENGFKTTLIYIGIGSSDEAVYRVNSRYQSGGHSVPEKDVRRRHKRSLQNLAEAIRQVDTAIIYDNSGNEYREVAVFEKGKLQFLLFTPNWFKKTAIALNLVFPEDKG
jgi:predicted ABC-type ATPase